MLLIIIEKMVIITEEDKSGESNISKEFDAILKI